MPGLSQPSRLPEFVSMGCPVLPQVAAEGPLKKQMLKMQDASGELRKVVNNTKFAASDAIVETKRKFLGTGKQTSNPKTNNAFCFLLAQITNYDSAALAIDLLIF